MGNAFYLVGDTLIHRISEFLMRLESFPRIKRQRRQAPGGAGFIAAVMRLAVLPGDRKFAADRGTLLVNAAPDTLANRALQGDAARRRGIRPFHDAHEIVEFVSQFDRHRAAFDIIAFRPVKRGAEVGAARAAGQAWMEGFVWHNSGGVAVRLSAVKRKKQRSVFP